MTSLVGCEKVLLEGEFRPVRFRAGDEPCVIPRLEEVVARHDDSVVTGVENALGVDASRGKADERFAHDARDDVVRDHARHLLGKVSRLRHAARNGSLLWGVDLHGHNASRHFRLRHPSSDFVHVEIACLHREFIERGGAQKSRLGKKKDAVTEDHKCGNRADVECSREV